VAILLFIVIAASVIFLLSNTESERGLQTGKIESFREDCCVAVSSRGLYCFFWVRSTEQLIGYIPQRLFHDPWKVNKIDSAQISIGPITATETTEFCYSIRDCLGSSLSLDPMFLGNLAFAGIVFPGNSEYEEDQTIALRVDRQGYSGLLESQNSSQKLYFVEGVVLEEETGICHQIGFYMRLEEDQLIHPKLEGESYAGVTYHNAESDEMWATKRLLKIGREGNWARSARQDVAQKLEEIEYFRNNLSPGSLIFESKERIDNDYKTTSQTLSILISCEKDLHLKEKNIIDWINLPAKFKSRDQITDNETSKIAYMEAKEKYEEVLELVKLYNLS
jgi:hypothetical protein